MAFSSLFSSRRRCPEGTHSLRSFRYDDVAAATSGFHPSALLGRGGHASVFRASLEGGRLLAAAKVVTSVDANPSASNEIEILSSVRSPLLVNLLGVTPDDDRPSSGRIAVVEFMPNGSLYDHLHRCRDGRALAWPRRLHLALQVAEAIHALHSLESPVIHRDIKSSNILIDGLGNARLADFGLAVRGRGGSARLPAGTIGYLDPGYIDPTDLSTKSDVFSFGVLLLEIITGRKAFDVDHSPAMLPEWAAPLIGDGAVEEVCDKRIRLPEGRVRMAVGMAAAVAARCVAASAKERPDMGEVVRWLKAAERTASPSKGLLTKLRRWTPFYGSKKVSHISSWGTSR